MMDRIFICKKNYRKFYRETAGAIAVAFAIMAPMLVGAAGMALDYAHAYLVQQRLLQAIDSSALAAASSSTDPAIITQKVKDFFETNYPPEKIGATFEPKVTVTDSDVIVKGTARYDTLFLRVIGIKTINVDAQTTVHRDVRGLEVALVLDNTGSMADGSKITALRTAATNFVNIIFSHTTDATSVKIGLVPYANGVRIGQYGLGKNPDNTNYDGGRTFVTLPNDVAYTTNHNNSSGWYGCVVEHNPNTYSGTAAYVSGSKGQLWKSGSSWNGHGWDADKTTNDPSPADTSDDWTGPWDIYQYGALSGTCTQYKCQTYSCTQYKCQTYACAQYKCQTYQCAQYKCKTTYTTGPNKGQCQTYYTSGTSNCQTFSNACQTYYTSGTSNCQTVSTTQCQTYYTSGTANCQTFGACQTYYTSGTANCAAFNYTFTPYSQPNINCPYTNILPLTSNKSTILSQINTMQAHGDTLGNVGAIWGYRILSPERPFNEGVQWNDERWHKAVVIMTDGINTRDPYYSNFWDNAKNKLDTTDYNDRLLAVCNKLKAKGVTVYTIILGTGGKYEEPDQTTKDYYKSCATSPAQYHDAPSNDELIGVFEEISRELSNIYIKQ